MSRFERQGSLVPLENMADLHVSVLGVGAVGRQVAIQLAGIGVQNICIVDPDTVELSNVTTQAYLRSEVGMPKVEAMASLLRAIEPSISVSAEFRGATRADCGKKGGVVFCCVDSIELRRRFFGFSKIAPAALWLDGRMLAETLQVFAAHPGNEHSAKLYEQTLFSHEEAEEGRCTARVTLYVANITAGLMVHQFARFLRGETVTSDMMLQLAADFMSVNSLSHHMQEQTCTG